MKLKNIDNLELWRWSAILNSIENNQTDFRYLIDVEDPTALPKFTELKNTTDLYIELLSNYQNINNGVHVYFTQFVLSLFQYELKNEKNNHLKLINEKTENLNGLIDKSNGFFNQYKKELDATYSSFEIKEFYFVDLPEFYDKLKDVKFYSVTEFSLLCKYFDYHIIANSELFIKKHVKTVNVKIDSIAKFDELLKERFKKLNGYDIYNFIRADLFDFQKMDMQKIAPKEKTTFADEIVFLQKATGVNLSMKTSVLSEYFAALRLAKMIEKNNSKNKI